MKNSTYLGKSLLAFIFAAFVLAAFAAVGWFFEQPFRTVSAIFALGLLVFVALLIGLAGAGYKYTLLWVRYLGFVSYLLGGLSALYLLGANAWKIVPYQGHRFTWIIVVAGIFAATHSWRNTAAEELLAESDAEDRRSESFANAEAAA